MSQISYIGFFDVFAKGKYLLELLARLENFGVGRVVTRGEWLRQFPDKPSFIVIKRVEPEMDRWLWKGAVYGDWTYRGQELGLHLFRKDLDRADWQLVRKEEEGRLRKACERLTLKMPRSVPLPPVLSLMEKGQDKADARIECTPILDREHVALRHFLEPDEACSAPPGRSIYDIDPSHYLHFYGEELPPRLDTWDVRHSWIE